MALEPITRQEKIIAGKDLEPVTRMEMFLKEYGGSGGSGGSGGGVTTLHINVTAVNPETMEITFTADKTPSEMQQAAVNGPIWCVVTFAAGILSEKAVSMGFPPAGGGLEPAFGLVIGRGHDENGNNEISYVVSSKSPVAWIVKLTESGS